MLTTKINPMLWDQEEVLWIAQSALEGRPLSFVSIEWILHRDCGWKLDIGLSDRMNEAPWVSAAICFSPGCFGVLQELFCSAWAQTWICVGWFLLVSVPCSFEVHRKLLSNWVVCFLLVVFISIPTAIHFESSSSHFLSFFPSTECHHLSWEC